jgi:ribose 5-phosphate isomerase B
MKLVIGSDHGGFEMKEKLKKFLQEQGHEVTDFGCYAGESADYPDPAMLVAEAVVAGNFERGVLLDGFGGAVAFAANKIPGARAVCAYDLVSAEFAAAHENANILCLGGKTIGELTLKKILEVWLKTQFEGGRHQKRLDKVAAIERRYRA